MDRVLFINACVRSCSRTEQLAKALLEKLCGDVEEVDLSRAPIAALDMAGLERRERAARERDFSHADFDLAKQFASADKIVIAAPYWDMMFPAVLKTYLENITVSGLTFRYSEQGRPQGLCRAKTLYYVTTAGGFIGENDFGVAYVKALAQTFFGISDVRSYTAEGLDLFDADVEAILQKAKAQIAADGSPH